MEISVTDFRRTVEDLEEQKPELILAKAKEAFQYCFYNKNAPAHRHSKRTTTEDIKGFKNRNIRFVDTIFHKDESITLITACGFYLRFYTE